MSQSTGFVSPWPILQLKHILREVDVRGRPDEEVLSVYRDHGVVPKSSRDDNFNRTPENLVSYKFVRPGDLAVNKMKAWQGSIAVSEHQGIVSGDYLVAEFIRTVDRRFFHYLLRSSALIHQYRLRSSGIRPAQWRLYWDGLREIAVPVPPIYVQERIAHFLDRETERIDRLVGKKRRLIELLGERFRVARIEMTRRGLDSSVDLFESGLPYIGRVPSHWKLAPHKAVMRLRREIVGTSSSEHTLLSLTRRGVIVRDVSANFGKFPSSFDTYQLAYPDDLVFCLFDVPETPRTVGLVRQKGMVTGAYSVFAFEDSNVARYVDHLYSGYDDEKSLSLFYTGLRNVIRNDTFGQIKMPLPPSEEIRAVVAALDTLDHATNSSVVKLDEQLDKLAEYRQALITAAVTGQLDISGELRDPEEVVA